MAASDFPGFEAPDDTRIWRYFPHERFSDVLNGALYFAAAQQFGDLFEGAMTAAARARRDQATPSFLTPEQHERYERDLGGAFQDLRRMTKINCWHARAHENVSMWERYCPRGGVAVRSTVGRLKRALEDFRLDPRYGAEPIRIGRVKYLDYDADDFADGSMLGIFFHKRAAFEDESEVRAILSLRMAVEFGVPIPDAGVPVAVDLTELIDQVRVGPHHDPGMVERVEADLRAVGVDCEVRTTTLADPPADAGQSPRPHQARAPAGTPRRARGQVAAPNLLYCNDHSCLAARREDDVQRLLIDLEVLSPAERRDLANALLRAAWSAALEETRIMLLDLFLDLDPELPPCEP